MVRQSAVLGVDGCPGGWIGALVSGPSVTWLLLPDAAAVLAVEADAVGIDIPIGLPDVGPRACDVAARARLGARRSSVFPAPVRAVLAASSYADARARSVAAAGCSLSAQAWNLVPRIADVDAAGDRSLPRRRGASRAGLRDPGRPARPEEDPRGRRCPRRRAADLAPRRLAAAPRVRPASTTPWTPSPAPGPPSAGSPAPPRSSAASPTAPAPPCASSAKPDAAWQSASALRPGGRLRRLQPTATPLIGAGAATAG